MREILYILIAFSFLAISCKESSIQQKLKTGTLLTSKLRFKSPVNNQIIKIGEQISLQIHHTDTINPLDSICFFLDTLRIGSVSKTEEALIMNTANAKSGTHTISAIGYLHSHKDTRQNIQVKFYPGFAPATYTYKIVNVFPHDKSAYTQGLLYNKGEMIESTGIKGQSTLRRVKLETGQSIQLCKLPDDVFGEGIAMFDDKVLQISWQDQVAYLYDEPTLTRMSQLNFPYKEGWGLTFDGVNLIMSDGSAYLYFLDKRNLAKIGRVEVCDNHGLVENINELEYIDGEVWANIYFSDTIVRIDPKTGVVLGKIDMSGLLDASDRSPETNVLNGIAYDPETKRIWVTGKNWPKLFQISVHQPHH